MEELHKGEFVYWESENLISILLKINQKITKYTLIPKDRNYLIVWARSKEKWSTFEYFKEKKDLDTSISGKYSLFKDAKKYLLKLENQEFILPHGLPQNNPLIAIKSEKPSNFKKYKQKKLSDVWKS